MPTHHEATYGAHVGASLDAYHAGSLPTEQANAVKRHLLECPTCRRQSEDIALDQLVRAAPAPTVGPELRQRVFSAIVAERTAQSGAARQGLTITRERIAHPHSALTSAANVRSGGRWVSGLVAALIVALIAGVLVAAPRAGRQGQRHQTPLPAKSSAACPANKVSIALPQHAQSDRIVMTSPTEGWAIGAITAIGVSGFPVSVQALLWHISDCHWTQVALNLPAGDVLNEISMDSPTDGWVLGQTYTAKPVLLHYTNGAWSQAPLPDDPAFTQVSPSVIQAFGPGEVWMTAYTPKTPTGQMSPMLLIHLANGVWTSVASPFPAIYGIAPVGANDLWIIGQHDTPQGGAAPTWFAHYHNGGWDAVQQSPAQVFTLHAISPTDIWASGASAAVEHYDGSAWRDAPQAIPPVSDKSQVLVEALGDGEGWAAQPAMSTPSASQSLGNVSGIWYETGGQWRLLNLPYKDIRRMYWFTPVSDGEVWAIGAYYVALPESTRPDSPGMSVGGGYDQLVLLHYVDGAWTRYG